jgi:plastocyanin
MIRKARLIVLSVLATVALTGCFSGEPKVAVADQVGADQAAAVAAAEAGQTAAPAGGGEGGEGGESLEFVAVDIDYSDAPDTAPAGPLTFALDNEGAAVHNVVIESVGEEAIVEANGGESATGNVTLEPGTYTYYCSIVGHRSSGMEGTLEVQ